MSKKTTQKTAKKAPKGKMDKAVWLQAALKYAAKDGWVPDILAKAAKDLGFDSALAAVVFPRGISDLVQEFHAWADETMEARIAAYKPFQGLKVRQKVAFAVRARFEAMAPHKAAVHELLPWALKPFNAPQALKLGWALCDKIWWAAGDTATDYNHYTKRLLLAQVYQRTLMFWLKDDSDSHAATWHYLDDRISEVLEIGKKIGQAKDFIGIAKGFIKSKVA